jgi:hypothetical protein
MTHKSPTRRVDDRVVPHPGGPRPRAAKGRRGTSPRSLERVVADIRGMHVFLLVSVLRQCVGG